MRKKKQEKQDFNKVVKPKLPRINVLLDKRNKKRIILEVEPRFRDLCNELLQKKYVPRLCEDIFYYAEKAQ